MRKLIKENKKGWPMSDAATPNEYYISQWLDKLDTAACEVESRWGVSRLERLVSFEMAQKWKIQMDKLAKAISENDIFTLPELVNGTIRGYEALERDAIAQGYKPMDAPFGWSVGLPSGKTLVVVRHPKDASLMNDLKRDHGEDVVVWTLDEIANIIENEYTLVNQPSVKNKKQSETKLGNDPFDFSKGDEVKL